MLLPSHSEHALTLHYVRTYVRCVISVCVYVIFLLLRQFLSDFMKLLSRQYGMFSMKAHTNCSRNN